MNDNITKIHPITEQLTLFGDVATTIDNNFELVTNYILQTVAEDTQTKITQVINDLKLWVQNVVTEVNSGGTVNLEGFVSDVLFQELKTKVSEIEEDVTSLKQQEHVFSSDLNDDIHVSYPVGNITTDVTIGDLKDKTFSQILQQMLFKETWPNVRSDFDSYCDIKIPSTVVSYNSIPWVFEGSQINPYEPQQQTSLKPSAVSYVTNADTVNLSIGFEGAPENWSSDQPFGNEGTVNYQITCQFNPKTVSVTSNLGNTQNFEYSGSTVTYTKTVSVVYPIILSNNEHLLTNSNIEITRTLQATETQLLYIAVPYNKDTEPSVSIQMETLGWIDANEETWTVSTIENYKDTSHTYRVWQYVGTIDPTNFKFKVEW